MIAVVMLLCGESCERRRQATPVLFAPPVMARSRVSDGNPTRLQRALAKARRGEPITIGVIGGSIALGEKASDPSRCFANLVADWWRRSFRDSHVTLINAGIENTGSNFGCMRVQRDLLSQHPDFVIVEFGVNDRDEQATFDTYEGVIRQTAADPNQPAILELFMMHHTGTNAQGGQIEIGKRYQLPMISYRDALWPEIEAGRMKLADVFADTVHPNDRGHAAVAAFVDALLQETLDHLPSDGQIPVIPPLPPARFTELFSHTTFLDFDALHPEQNTGWVHDAATQSWKSDVPGSSVTFAINGSLIDLMFYRRNGAFGVASVIIDNSVPMALDSWFDGTWGGYEQTTELARNLSPGAHRVTVRLLGQHNPLSTGDEFRIMGLGAAR